MAASWPRPLRLRLDPKGGPGVEERVRELVEREGGRCSFFTFGIDTEPESVRLDVSASPAYEAVPGALGAPGRAECRGRGVTVVAGPAQRADRGGDGVNIRTLRYAEWRGLLAAPGRSPGGHRPYAEEAVTALRVIKAARRLGFTLQEVAELPEAGRRRPGRSGTGLQGRAVAKLAEVDVEIADLTTIRIGLSALSALAVPAVGACSPGRRRLPCACAPETAGESRCGCTRPPPPEAPTCGQAPRLTADRGLIAARRWTEPDPPIPHPFDDEALVAIRIPVCAAFAGCTKSRCVAASVPRGEAFESICV